MKTFLAIIMAASRVACAAVATGPEVGSTVPAFSLVDQNGQPRGIDNLKGPNGLVLVFVRSADW